MLPALSAGNESESTIDVDVDPCDNAGNALAEYAISIGGGGYTLGSDWVQTDGSVAGSGAWQTDATWGIETVTGLNPMTEYTFEVMARYIGTITRATLLGAGGAATTTPEPATIALLGFGCLFMYRRRRS